VLLSAVTGLGLGVAATHADAATASLVKDINPGTESSEPLNLEGVGGTVFFSASIYGELGFELWKSDGTNAGTTLVRDISPGPGYGVDPDVHLTRVRDMLLFPANDDVHGPELWRSDGTEAGTGLVKDIHPGSAGSISTYAFNRGTLAHRGRLFFTAWDGVHGFELWRSDGTSAGTRLVRDVNPGNASSRPRWLTSVGDTLFFTARDGEHGRELWRSDGTEAGTRLVRDFHVPRGSPASLANFRGTLFFSSAGGGHGRELWRSNGTADGTRLVKDIKPRGGSVPYGLTGVGRKLVFFAYEKKHGRELWRSDGTTAGTKLIRDLVPGREEPDVYALTPARGELYFNGDNLVHSGLWKSDGTGAGTKFLKRISLNGLPGVSVGETTFFSADDGGLPYHGIELWATDGTRAGTKLVRDINPGRPSSAPDFLTAVGGELFFNAWDGVHGVELWKATP
jgi:ELWxxDGT repeat protein